MRNNTFLVLLNIVRFHSSEAAEHLPQVHALPPSLAGQCHGWRLALPAYHWLQPLCVMPLHQAMVAAAAAVTVAATGGRGTGIEHGQAVSLLCTKADAAWPSAWYIAGQHI